MRPDSQVRNLSHCVPSPLGESGVTFQGPFGAPGLAKQKPVPLLSRKKAIFSIGGSALGVLNQGLGVPGSVFPHC